MFGGLGTYVRSLGNDISSVDLLTGDAVVLAVKPDAAGRLGLTKEVRPAMFDQQRLRRAVRTAIWDISADRQRCGRPAYAVPPELQAWLDSPLTEPQAPPAAAGEKRE